MDSRETSEMRSSIGMYNVMQSRVLKIENVRNSSVFRNLAVLARRVPDD